jgi:hypothetical protein
MSRSRRIIGISVGLLLIAGLAFFAGLGGADSGSRWSWSTSQVEAAVKDFENARSVTCVRKVGGPQVHRWSCQVDLKDSRSGVIAIGISKDGEVSSIAHGVKGMAIAGE